MTNYVDAFEYATGPDDISSLVDQAIYKWGLRIPEGEEILSIPLSKEVSVEEKLSLTYPTNTTGNIPADDVKANGLLVNGIPLYGMFGKVANATPLHTITNYTISEGMKPLFNVVEKIGSLNPHVVHATLFHDLTLTIAKGTAMVFELTGKGHKNHSPNWALQTPTYPSSEGRPFDILQHFKWGVDGSEASIDGVSVVSMKSTQAVIAVIGDDGWYEYISAWTPIFSAITMTYTGEEATLQADQEAGTKRSLLWKVAKSSDPSNDHLEFDPVGNSVICTDIIHQKRPGEVIASTAVFAFQDMTMKCQDQLADALYP